MDDDNDDRLSSLPDSLIHEIFKFMDTRLVVSTSLLSRRWNSLWHSNPYLNFILDTWEKGDDADDEEILEGFENFVDQVLRSRDRNSDLQAFCIKRYSGSPLILVDKYQWINHAISSNVRHIQLQLVEIYDSTLEVLCESVKCLTLEEVDIFCIKEGEELLLNCPFMETLVLHNCIFGEGDYTYRNIKLSAPLLKVLKFDGGYSRNYTIDNLSSIVTAMVRVSIWPDEDLGNDREHFLDNILRGLTNAKYLIFSLDNLPACSKVPITLNTVATFQSLRHLKLATGFTYSESVFYFSTTLKLLEKCPNVETLVLDGDLKWKPEIMEEDLVAGLQSWCRSCHLKTLEIEGWQISISDCAFKFIKCIMRNAASLKNVIMTAADIPMEQEALVNFCMRLKVKPKVTKVSSRRIQVSLKPSTKIQWKNV